MSSEATGGPVLQNPHPSLSTLVENPSSFGGKTCSMGRRLAIRKAFWNALLRVDSKYFFFLLSCDGYDRYFVSELCFETPKY